MFISAVWGIFTALISSTYSIEIIRFFYKKGWCIRLPDEVPLMTRNGFQLLIPLLVVMLSISVMNAAYCCRPPDASYRS